MGTETNPEDASKRSPVTNHTPPADAAGTPDAESREQSIIPGTGTPIEVSVLKTPDQNRAELADAALDELSRGAITSKNDQPPSAASPESSVAKALYSYSDLLSITDALKFAAKIFTPDRTLGVTQPAQVRANVPVPLLESAVDIALQLIVAGAPTKYVVAGILNDVFSGYVDFKRADLNTTINRKFGDLDDSGKISDLIGLVSKTDSPIPDVWLQRKAKVVSSLIAEIPDTDRLKSPYNQHDLMYMTKALRYVHNTFGEAKPRPWGPNETLPMFHHASQVGLLLVGSGQPKEVVVAGLMHDFYEGYVKRPTRTELEKHVRTHFGDRVHDLIHAITEPPKGPEEGNWRERKLSVVNSLRSAGRDANTIVCASKISTMAEGNKFLHVNGNVEGWSAGSWKDNLGIFTELRQIFADNQVPWSLVHRYDVELERWGKHGN
jgi:hypothetical protein